ncbi:anti-sigma factor [Rhizobium sp. SL42]|uniref:anti-sigma factor n=1 Tax=Rhizobium sp. SL42 TaxID=2806346 RepID=UPI001F028677|nr:anti-sigma factor [Rhizobium sp. SL42]UJW76127.1 anti-sigma factor [Rhizobium sp. SL42]
MTDRQNIDERADAYVLGLMDETDRQAFEAAMEDDAALQRAVGLARDRFLELDLAGKATSLSADLWTRIENRLAKPDAAQSGTPDERIATPAAPPANDNAIGAVGRWKRMALAATAASALLIASLDYTLTSKPDPQVIAILMNDAGQPVVMIEDFGNDAARVTPLVDVDVPADRSLQVWTLPSKDLGPVSLGVLDSWRTVMVEGPGLPGPREAQLYEITVEPLGGSPTGRPTGPILGKGFAKVPR